MKLTSFYHEGKLSVGMVLESEVADLTSASGGTIDSMESLIAVGEAGKRKVLALAESAPRYPLDGLCFAPVVTAPEKIFCIGLNYLSHATEEKEALPKYPEVFNKYNNVLAANEESIPIPAVAGQIDYEAELVVVIGREASCVSEENAMEYVYGYTCGNDISARQEQFRVTQWCLGKTCDKFGPVGPWIVTRDEIDGEKLDIRLYCNGELRQHDNTANLLFKIPHLVSYLSQYITLKPGDLIFTGTCAGCITGIVDENGEHPWLGSGDELVVEIEGIGQLHNTIA